MATAIQRATAIVDALIGGTASPSLKTKVADAFAAHWDPTASTNEEKALVFIAQVKEFCRDIVKAETRKTETSTVQAQIDTAVDSSVSDLPPE